MPRDDSSDRFAWIAAVVVSVVLFSGILAGIGFAGWWAWDNVIPLTNPKTITHEILAGRIESGEVNRVVVQGQDILARPDAGNPVVVELDESNRVAILKELRVSGVHITEIPRWYFYLASAIAVLMFVLWMKETVHFLRSMIAAAFYTLLLFYIHSVVQVPMDLGRGYALNALRNMLFESGTIPIVILWTALACLHHLYQLWRYRLTPMSIDNAQDHDVIVAAKMDGGRMLDTALDLHGRRGYYGERLHRLRDRFRHESDITSIISLKNDILDIDEERYALAFVAIRWGEVVLPVLGFLGTVVGIGDAMDGVSEGLSKVFAGEPLNSALSDLNVGFRGMAIAFDTTFLGLSGLLLVGMTHVLVRNGLASKLAEARSLLTEAVYGWKLADSNEALLTSIQSTVADADARSAEFWEKTRIAAEHVIQEDPQFESIRKVLFHPVVAFAETGTDLLINMRKFISEELGESWEYSAIGVFARESNGGIVAIQANDGTNFVLRFNDAGPIPETLTKAHSRIVNIVLCGNDGDFLAISETSTSKSNLFSKSAIIGKLDLSGQYKQSIFANDLQIGDLVLPVAANGKDGGLLLKSAQPSSSVDGFLAITDALVEVGRLPEGVRWYSHSSDRDSGTVFSLGESLGDRKWVLLKMKLNPDTDSDANAGYRLDGMDQILELDFSSERKPQSVTAISHDIVLLVDSKDGVHYWSKGLPRPRRVAETWVEVDSDSALICGAGGWVALARQERLTMWRVYRGGSIKKYQGSPADLRIENVDTETLCTGSNGSVLYGVGEQGLYRWDFPKLKVDEL